MIQKKHFDTPRAQRPDAESNSQIVCGIRPVMEAIESGRQLDRVYIQHPAEGALLTEVKSMLNSHGIPFQYVPIEKLNKLTTAHHQGVVATIAPIRYYKLEELLAQAESWDHAPFLLLLDHITDVRNMGAIARTAECAGVDAIVVPDHGSAQLNADAIKTSSGALLRLPVCREKNLKTAVNLAKATGLQVVAATEKGATHYLQVNFRQPTLLLLGSEDTGIGPDLLKLCDAKAYLPIKGNVQSLNVSVASAIFIYEMLRQRNA